jgi:hypothetical protein
MTPFGKTSEMRSSGDYVAAAVTINEDDIGVSGNSRIRRCMSIPDGIEVAKSIMKWRTLDESIHSAYGSADNKGDRGGIQFDKVVLREYSRTLGDNPSCSAGPPVR